MGILDNFIVSEKKIVIDSKKYISDLESGVFRDKFNLGIMRSGGKWLLKNFQNEPNALFVGAMGSGKSFAAAFTAVTWMASNSDQTIMFICDVLKGAGDYAPLFELPNVYTVLNEKGYDAEEGVKRVIDMAYSEAMARQELFNEVGAPNISSYEEKTGKKMARIVILIEEFHAVPYKVFEFDKNFKKKYTVAEKFFTLMKIGRSLGVWFIAASQKSTSSDIPPEVVTNFLQKQIFKVSAAEAQYVLGTAEPAYLTSAQKGRCFTDYGEVQFPAFGDSSKNKPEEKFRTDFVHKSMSAILKKYAKPLSAQTAYLTDDIIKAYLSGKNPRELYSNKKMSELIEAIEGLDKRAVIDVLFERMGIESTKINFKTDPSSVSFVSKIGNESFTVIIEDSKMTAKNVKNAEKSIPYHGVNKSLIIHTDVGISSTIYKIASESGVVFILDLDDLRKIANQIDAGESGMAKDLIFELSNTDSPEEIETIKTQKKKRKKLIEEVASVEPIPEKDDPLAIIKEKLSKMTNEEIDSLVAFLDS